MEFSPLTIDITKQLSKEIKKKEGIFITPRRIVQKLHDLLLSLPSVDFSRVLEPSCGTCEIVQYLDKTQQGIVLDAVEKNDTIFSQIQQTVWSGKNEIRLFHQDFMRFSPDRKYTLIIGNPPYVVCSAEQIPEQYKPFVVGRPNLFALFILHAYSLLEERGVLAFIVPKSFLNASYYNSIRCFLKENGEILSVLDFEQDNLFLETQQATIGFVFRKITGNKSSQCPYSLRLNDQCIFNHRIPEINTLLQNSTTLQKLGLKVKTGTVVWNQHKNILTDDPTGTLLIYNSNIVQNGICLKKFSKDEKKQFIRLSGNVEPIIVVNRGNGNSSYKLTYSWVDGSTPYLIENHLNIIYSPEKKRELLEPVYKSLQNPKTLRFIELYFGNGGLSKTELETILPIYL